MAICWIGILLYLVSLAMPGFVIRSDYVSVDGSTVWYGYNILRSGWAGILIGQDAWYSNVLLLGALLAIPSRKFNVGARLAGAAFVWGLQSFLFCRLPQNEGEVNDLIVDRLGPGFYLWELSFLLLSFYCFMMIGPQKRGQQLDRPIVGNQPPKKKMRLWPAALVGLAISAIGLSSFLTDIENKSLSDFVAQLYENQLIAPLFRFPALFVLIAFIRNGFIAERS
jgi:hypothetical protein